MWAVVYSPDTTLIILRLVDPTKLVNMGCEDTDRQAAGRNSQRTRKLGEPIVRLGHGIRKQGSRSRFWSLDEHTSLVSLQYLQMAASSQVRRTTRRCDCGISKRPAHQFAPPACRVSYLRIGFHIDGKALATDHNVYLWDVAAIIRKAGLDDLLSDPKVPVSTCLIS